MNKLFAALVLAALAAPVWAATQTVTLAKTNAQKLTKATQDAGYPSSVKQ